MCDIKIKFYMVNDIFKKKKGKTLKYIYISQNTHKFNAKGDICSI